MQKVFNYQVFLDPPRFFNPGMEAAGCYLTCGDKVLLVKRQSTKSQGNKWGVPAGKLEKNEDSLSAVIREMQEEVGIFLTPELLCKFKTLYIRLTDLDYIFHMYYSKFTEIPSIKLDFAENQASCWSTVRDALKMPLIASGREALLYYNSFLSLSKKPA